MCANATNTAPLSPHLSTGRSLLSRLTSPLRSRARNLTEFQIRPDEPHRKYSPGDLVKGAVILTIVKPVRVTHLTVCLHGFVRVFKNPNAVNEPFVDPGLTASVDARKSQYFGNGHASLFQDEVTLCGEGRLDIGVYEFNFELEFPSKGLPTSIDFERGTISYLITATLTRPTSMMPTSSCDQKIALVESIDIGPLLPPKPRTISLEPIARKSKKKGGKSKDGSNDGSKDGSKDSKDGSRVGRKDEPREETDTDRESGSASRQLAASPQPDESASQCDTMDHQVAPMSPVASDRRSTVSAANSTDSAVSSSTGLSFRVAAAPSSKRSTLEGSDSKGALAGQTITATIELLKSGCLPGDNLPLKISIKHIKAIRSVHGIIITMYRQGRIDSAPPLSLFADIKGKEAERLKHEEYYPKSKTGLGGLSLSSAGSSSMFRKDLAQTFAPILVDPMSLTTVVNASIRVPEDVFPTILGVPGQMITFKYHIEVVVDLGGKLAGQQRHVPRLGAVPLPSNFMNSSTRGDGNSNMITAWGGNIVGTENIRREKSVVACVFEVVVGTKDSSRVRTRGNSSATRQINDWTEDTIVTPYTTNGPIYEEFSTHGDVNLQQGGQHNPYPYYESEGQYPEYYAGDGYEYRPDYHQEQYPPAPHAHTNIPPPEIEAEEGLDEKERARRAEARLLPSRPPGPEPGPSAPPTESEEDLYNADDITPQASNAHPSTFAGSTAPSAPALEDLGPNGALGPTDDKQELERRRLMAEASRPSFPPDADDNAGEGSSGSQNVPSAPILMDDDGYGGQYSHHDLPGRSSHRETLPKYEK